ncbi:MAG: bifunctional methylenetetrahydrofolate dehydrogenase/methenyltetrahydrofolate cyclohydrolase FolD [Sutterellaceae bacterium]|nr:bifunctional methylenetetrahydrofolate dehydrogenase/methenyltetrahydrofolate cyclohydrolase FolD [Sutterellaceae bacterium]
MAQIIDGKALAAEIRQQLKTRVEALVDKGHRPALAVILVGDDPASQVYVRNKIRACAETGIESLEFRMPAETSQETLLSKIDELNRDDKVDGILVQMPVPKHIDSMKVIDAISPLKDVDGFHVVSAGALMTGQKGFLPCTPYGVMKLLEKAGCDLTGKHAVVVGRSNIVGKPQAMLLLSKHATVTVAHSRTADLGAVTRQADVLIAAVGRAKLIKADMVKPGAVVIDVGMNRDENGKLCGDVDFETVKDVAGAITPVPGGVGPMTIAMLLTNTVEAVERRFGIDHA